jgi:restriction endonuclease S subunit
MNKILKTILKNIASVQTGVFLKPQSEGEILYVQVKHFNNNLRLFPSLHADLKEYSVNQKHILTPGDILFAAKGSNNFAAVYQNNYPKAVASTSFFVIKLTDENILPDYLAWFINYPKTMELLKSFATGTSISSISKSVLEDLEISVPEMPVQQAILRINELQLRQKTLVSKIENLREQLIQYQIINSIK